MNTLEVLFDEDSQLTTITVELNRLDADLICRDPLINHDARNIDYYAPICKGCAYIGRFGRFANRIAETLFFGRSEGSGFFDDSVRGQPSHLGLAKPQANRISLDSQFHGRASHSQSPDDSLACLFWG